MYIAKINRKEELEGGVEIYVDFTNGARTTTEYCVPQNREGYEFWVKSRLEALNSAEELKSELVDGAEVVFTTQPVLPTPTAEEQARYEWLVKYRRWVEVKTKLIDTGIITASNPKATALLNDVKATIKPEYLDYI